MKASVTANLLMIVNLRDKFDFFHLLVHSLIHIPLILA